MIALSPAQFAIALQVELKLVSHHSHDKDKLRGPISVVVHEREQQSTRHARRLEDWYHAADKTLSLAAVTKSSKRGAVEKKQHKNEVEKYLAAKMHTQLLMWFSVDPERL